MTPTPNAKLKKHFPTACRLLIRNPGRALAFEDCPEQLQFPMLLLEHSDVPIPPQAGAWSADSIGSCLITKRCDYDHISYRPLRVNLRGLGKGFSIQSQPNWGVFREKASCDFR